MINEQITIIFTIFLVLLIEYIRFFNETRSPFFFKYTQMLLPLIVYLFGLVSIAILAIFVLCNYTSIDECEYPLNILFVSVISSIFSTGIINNIEFFLSENEMNKIRKIINDYRMNIIISFNQNATSEVRKTIRQLEQSNISVPELKNELRKLDPTRFTEAEKDYDKFDEKGQKSMYSWEIAQKDPAYAKTLLE